MPVFFFDFDDAETWNVDHDGTELPDAGIACAEAAAALPALARDALLQCEGVTEFGATVRDAAGAPLYRVVLTVTGERL